MGKNSEKRLKYPTVEELKMAIATICVARLKELAKAIEDSPVSARTWSCADQDCNVAKL